MEKRELNRSEGEISDFDSLFEPGARMESFDILKEPKIDETVGEFAPDIDAEVEMDTTSPEAVDLHELMGERVGIVLRHLVAPDHLRYGPVSNESIADFGDPGPIDPEVVDDYLSCDRYEENLQKDFWTPATRSAYGKLIESYPALRIVALEDSEESGDAYFSCTDCKRDENTKKITEIRPVVRTDFHLKSPQTLSHYMNAVKVAEATGCNPQELVKDDDKMAIFYMMHEMGHARDFIVSLLKPCVRKFGAEAGMKVAVSEWQRQSVIEAVEQSDSVEPFSISDEEMRRIGLSKIQGAELTNELLRDYRSRVLPQYLRRVGGVGIDNESTYQYRQKTHEVYADDFARDFFKDHEADYFLPFGVKADGGERLGTGEPYELDLHDLTYLFDFREGSHVRLMEKGGQKESVRGYLLSNLNEYGVLELAQNPDPLNPGEIRQMEDIESATYRVIPSPGKDRSRNFSELRLRIDGREFVASADSKKRKPIRETMENFIDVNGMVEGEEIQMIASSIDGAGHGNGYNTETNVAIGDLAYGRLISTPEIGKPIRMLVESGESESGLAPWETLPVVSVDRDWDIWYIKTENDADDNSHTAITYRLIPLPENEAEDELIRKHL